ncbi:hypothetical protein GTH32_18745 [Alteromonas sp. 345S023]|uniref:Uncharacterized protein n=1 Tax=Alteromonas profundi TaxID=2696062 RepID=A0A7X5RMK9_9ALTE|nr:hypothetical protein [Alteromonas profundi]NDV93213.1 hypothetical protein [Alteromonas profundi]
MSVVSHAKRFWRFHSFIAIAVSVSALTLGCAVKEPAFYEGTWVITEAHGARVSAVSPSEANTLLGRSLYYAKDSAKLTFQQCPSPQYSTTTLKLDDFAKRYNIDTNTLKFRPGTVTEVILECGDEHPDVGSILVYQENTAAYTVFDGTFYRIEKTIEVAPI